MKTLCIVEDDINVLSLMVDLLKHTYNVENFNHSMEALKWLKKNGASIDLLILDINMPVLDGIELGEIIQDLYPDLKILYMSGYVSQGEEEEIKDGFFIYKPFTFKELTDKIEEVMGT